MSEKVKHINNIQAVHFTRNWGWILLFCIPIPVLMLSFFIWRICPPLISVLSGNPLPARWTWTNLLVESLFLIVSAAFPIWVALVAVLTTFHSKSIKKPGLFGYREIRWDEIRKIEAKNFSLDPSQLHLIKFYSQDKNLTVNAIFIKDQESLMGYINNHVVYPDKISW